MKRLTQLLLIEDDISDRVLMKERAARFKMPVEIESASSIHEAKGRIDTHKPDIIVSDLGLPDSEGINTVRHLSQFAKQIPLIIITSSKDDTISVDAIKEGAQDYLQKSTLNSDLLEKTIRFTLERQEILSELSRTNQKLKKANGYIKTINNSLEQRVKDRTKALNQQLSIRSHFIKSVSHEVRTPLTSMSGALKMLKQRGLPKELSPLVDTIDGSSRQISHFFESILDLTLIKGDGITLSPSRFSLEKLIKDLVSYANERALDSSNSFSVLENLKSKNMLIGDPYFIAKMVKYLLDNAFQFTNRGKVELNIDCVNYGNSDLTTLSFSVLNTGPIIEESRRETIFEEFIKADPNAHHIGAGLGLPIARNIAKKMDGDVVYTPDPKRGNRFTCWITLPKA